MTIKFTVETAEYIWPDDHLAIQGEKIRVYAARSMTGDYTQIGVGVPDSTVVNCEWDVARGETIYLKARAEVAGELSGDSGVFPAQRPLSLPVTTILRVKFDQP